MFEIGRRYLRGEHGASDERLSLAVRLGCDQFSGGDQAFLVGQPNCLSGSYCFVSRLKPGDPDDRADHEIHLGVGCDPDRAGLPVNDFDTLHSRCLQP